MFASAPGWRIFSCCAAAVLALAGVAFARGRQMATASGGNSATTAASKAAASSDTILAAMAAELDRSKAQLKMDNLPTPYYVEYHVTDLEEFYAEAAFGALRLSQTTHSRSLRVVVRVGDYKQDSSGPGGSQGVADLAPIDNDQTALRRALWLATDSAYKSAAQALANKQANQTQFTGDQGFDDFAHAQPLQSVGPLAHLNVDPKAWTDLIVKASALYRTDPKLDSLTSEARFRVVNKYFVNSEGTVTRQGSEVYSLFLNGSTQASDGMRLTRSPDFVAAKVADLPSPDKFEADAADMIASLKALRDAPVVEEDYLGPVLFAPDAATDLVAALIGENVTGDRPRAGDTARTTGGFASSYKSRVLPAFLSAVDDPTMTAFQDTPLVGSYAVDDEGVRAQKVSLIENGQLTNYLLGREPIRDFPESNGHGRAAPGQAPRPSASNLIVQASQSLSPADLKKKLLDMCRDQNKPYGYLAQTVLSAQVGGGRGRGASPASLQVFPVLLYRVYAQDGHEELVRGATFDELDTRSLRGDIVAAGNDPLVNNRAGAIPTTVISPSLLFDELEIRRTDEKNPKLPEYAAPTLTSSAR
jgi:predicted Zn-dependent protease